MKYLLTIVLLSYSLLYAQDKSTSFLKHQVGIGATEFINSVFSSDDNAYGVEYRYHKSDMIAYRAGISYLQDTSVDGFIDIGLKAGIDKQLKKFKKWEFYYGIDLLTNYSNFESNNKDLFKVGIAPFFGIMLNISDNFSLSTEPLFFIRYNYLKDNDTFETDNTKDWVQAGLGKIGFLQLNFHF